VTFPFTAITDVHVIVVIVGVKFQNCNHDKAGDIFYLSYFLGVTKRMTIKLIVTISMMNIHAQ
jgi:hypothetical protein